MAGSDYQFVLEVFDLESRLLYQSLVKPDWLPAMEAAKLAALRLGRSNPGQDKIVPTWSQEHGQPRISGVRAVVSDGDGFEAAADISFAYFEPYARTVSQTLVQSGVLKAGEQFIYKVKAFPVSAPEIDARPKGGMTIERIISSPIAGERDILDYRKRVEAQEGAGEQPFPVFMPRHILDEAHGLKEQAQANETGGILIGHLWQDPQSLEPFIQVTGLIPARHTIADSKRLTFTPQTWADVRAAIDLRGMGESYCGWLHTHPSRYWCHCDTEKLQTCPLARQFFSEDDCLLHRTVFYAAHHVAIVLGDRYVSPGGWETVSSAYGWRNGLIESRGFHVLGEHLLENGGNTCQEAMRTTLV